MSCTGSICIDCLCSQQVQKSQKHIKQLEAKYADVCKQLKSQTDEKKGADQSQTIQVNNAVLRHAFHNEWFLVIECKLEESAR